MRLQFPHLHWKLNLGELRPENFMGKWAISATNRGRSFPWEVTGDPDHSGFTVCVQRARKSQKT